MPVLLLSEKLISTLQCPPEKAKVEFCDSVVKGLLLEVRSSNSGSGSYRLRYKDGAARTRYFGLGKSSDISLAMARKMAAEKKAEIRKGANPSLERKEQKKIPTLRQFVEEQYAPHFRVRKRSYRTDEGRFNHRILPAFKDTRLDQLSTKQLMDFHTELREVHGLAPASCDHHIKLIRHVFNTAIKWSVIEKNPAARISLFHADNQVENVMDEQQLQRLLVVLNTHPNRAACRIAMLALSTGCRLNEVLRAEWSQIDLNQRVWRIPATNSKSKRMRPVPLNESAMEVLKQVRDDHPEWVFVNHRTGTRYKTLHNAWRDIREQAGMPWLRIHDLRHTYASLLVNHGRSLFEVQTLLGHSSPQVTQRYSHMNTEVLLSASEVASDLLKKASPRLLPAALPTDAPQDP